MRVLRLVRRHLRMLMLCVSLVTMIGVSLRGCNSAIACEPSGTMTEPGGVRIRIHESMRCGPSTIDDRSEATMRDAAPMTGTASLDGSHIPNADKRT